MGIGGISPGSILLILLLIVLLFGRQRLRTLGEDLALMLKGFKKGLNEENKQSQD